MIPLELLWDSLPLFCNGQSLLDNLLQCYIYRVVDCLCGRANLYDFINLPIYNPLLDEKKIKVH